MPHLTGQCQAVSEDAVYCSCGFCIVLVGLQPLLVVTAYSSLRQLTQHSTKLYKLVRASRVSGIQRSSSAFGCCCGEALSLTMFCCSDVYLVTPAAVVCSRYQRCLIL